MIEAFNSYKEYNELIIKNIKDGVGITLFLSNEGDTSIFNITINCMVSIDFFVCFGIRNHLTR